jgi:enamine deaminase RidA (YjgF/YER057c/UK114 family)
MPNQADARIQELNLTLPPAPKPVAKYKTALVVGNILFVSGHGPLKADKTMITGRVGAELTLEDGKAAARQVGLAILATMKATLGNLSRVKRLVKTLGLVQCTPEFKEQPLVINGFSELMAELFGDDAGVGTRSAVGTNALPSNIAVEIECQWELEPA